STPAQSRPRPARTWLKHWASACVSKMSPKRIAQTKKGPNAHVHRALRRVLPCNRWHPASNKKASRGGFLVKESSRGRHMPCVLATGHPQAAWPSDHQEANDTGAPRNG